MTSSVTKLVLQERDLCCLLETETEDILVAMRGSATTKFTICPMITNINKDISITDNAFI
jgi:hypothetical protein